MLGGAALGVRRIQGLGMNETIAALASGVGKAGIAVIRLSGPAVATVLEGLAGGVPVPRQAVKRSLRRGADVIDEALVLFFAAPASFTGEDVAEFHVHGGRAVIHDLLETLTGFAGVRLAERGEFTRRAVANGKFDLTTGEAIAALVDAETASQRRQALRQAGGALEQAALSWRQRLLRCLALMEAEIDFPDEEDVPELRERVRADVAALLGELRAALAGAAQGERVREGAIIVVAGPPNAGKSTLVNALARREVAIVSPFAGTTRDTIEVHLDLDGYAATLIDTAGLRETSDPVEQIGVARAMEKADRADLVLWLQASDALASPPAFGAPVLTIATKVDLDTDSGSGDLAVSAKTGTGLVELTARLTAAARVILEGGESALVTRERHRREIEIVAAHCAAVAEAGAGVPVELLAEDLRLAVRAIGRLTGQVDIDEVYDLIFREFCIGK